MELPLISCIQKLVLYETKARYYIVGSNQIESAFRVLKIDRTEARELHIQDDKHIYNKPQIMSLLTMIESGNRTTGKAKSGTGLTKTVSAYGIVGFVRFLEGYYIILITKRRKVALLGGHTVYKIEDTVMQYIPNDSVRYTHPEEGRYVKMFQSVDLSSNFYFSYSYDLTHTLQYNLAPAMGTGSGSQHTNTQTPRSQAKAGNHAPNGGQGEAKQDCLPLISEEANLASSEMDNEKDFYSGKYENKSPASNSSNQDNDGCVYGVRSPPAYRFVWNQHLLRNFEDQLHRDWVLYITYGFIEQSNVCVYGKSIYITLLARRSNEFAGTRFLKRGANSQGAVANEVETEQIVYDASVTELHKAKLSSFVQMRGSVPVYWSQDVSKMVPKPPIALDQRDPYFHTAGIHFNKCFKRYGAPILLLNLIKRREKRMFESLLNEEYKNSKTFLNQFLPKDLQMLYIGFDMAHYTKSKSTNVLVRLARIAENCVKQTGFYFRCPSMEENFWQQEQFQGLTGHKTHHGIRQTGVVRTNCIDCLDRTNTAQFAVGKCALAYQLCALGVVEKPELDFDTDCLKILEELYEDQGDTVALQYGGSNLVHRIEGYRKIAPWKSHSRDIMQTLSRYYSNTFSDLEKQQATNVFLGLFIPKENKPNIWDLPTDFYLHNTDASGQSVPRRSYTSWCESEVFDKLPLPYEEEMKPSSNCVIVKTSPSDERVDSFFEYYKPYELTTLDELFSYSMIHSVRNFMPKNAKTASPFSRRGGIEPNKESSQELNPNISGKDSTSSLTSKSSDDTGSGSSSDDDIDVTPESSESEAVFEYYERGGVGGDPGEEENVYGLDLKDQPDDVEVYERYASLGVPCLHPTMVKKGSDLSAAIDISPLSDYSDCFSTSPPEVSHRSKELYINYVRCGQEGASTPSQSNQEAYKDYIRQKYK